MADKELRRMNRTELIEIIYALQQNEQKLREENDKMAAELEDRKIRMDESGSIAEAALSLNHIFENAQAAADQYLLSLQSREEVQPEPEQDQPEQVATVPFESEYSLEEEKPEAGAEEINPESEKILEDARRQADQILEDARREADGILETARVQAEPAAENGTEKASVESEEILEDARRQADQILTDARQQAVDILEDARRQSDELLASAHQRAEAEAEKNMAETRQQCDKERRAVKDYHDKFLQDMSDILKENPELLDRVRRMGTLEGA